MAGTEFPENWQELVLQALTKARTTDVSKTVFGLTLPESWKSELQYYSRTGEISRLFGVRAVTFSGKSISVFDKPEPKEALKSKKAG